MIAMLGKNWLTITEAAVIVGCSAQRLRKLAAEKQIKAAKVGERVWLIDSKSAQDLANNPAKTGRPRGSKKKL